MAFYVLFVAHGMNVNLHFCTENHHVMSSFGDASRLCEHCLGHHHHEQADSHELEGHFKVVHFAAKCCCEDYESEVGFADNYTFSSENSLMIYLPFTAFMGMCHSAVDKMSMPDFQLLAKEKIPHLLTGRLKTIFFLNLKLNPLSIGIS